MARHFDVRKERHWLKLVLLWQDSRLPVREFCRRRRLRVPNFYFWRRTLQQRGLLDSLAVPRGEDEEPVPPAFVNITLEPGPSPASPFELVLGEQRLLRVHPGFDPDTLRQLLRLLEEPPC